MLHEDMREWLVRHYSPLFPSPLDVASELDGILHQL